MASFSIGVSILDSKQSYVQKSLTSILTCILLIEEMLTSDRTVRLLQVSLNTSMFLDPIFVGPI